VTINEVPTSHGPGDTELIMATRAGDTAAFGDLYGRHAPVAASRTKSRTENDTPAISLTLALPTGITLDGTDAGDGWTCTPAPAGATCDRGALDPGEATTARIPVRVGKTVSGWQQVAATVEAGESTGAIGFKVAVAPAGLHVGYAAAGSPAELALAGNTLLSCPVRPECLEWRGGRVDNQDEPMIPYRPGPDEPAPPPAWPPPRPPAVPASPCPPTPGSAGPAWSPGTATARSAATPCGSATPPVGPKDNACHSQAAGAIEGDGRPTFGVDVAAPAATVPADDATLTLTAGHDPLEVGVLALLAETAEPVPSTG